MQTTAVAPTVTLRVLVADDEPAMRRFLASALDGYFAVSEAATGQDTLDMAAARHPELVILGLDLPDIDGIEVTRRLRAWTDAPIIVVSGRDRETDKIAALDAGADDYLTKPLGGGELMARIRSIMRRAAKRVTEPVYSSGDLMVDLQTHEVRVKGSYVALTRTEYGILQSLVAHAGRVLTHQQLIQAVWSGSYEKHAHRLHVNISNLRRKIEIDPVMPRYIVTEPGIGYRLQGAGR